MRQVSELGLNAERRTVEICPDLVGGAETRFSSVRSLISSSSNDRHISTNKCYDD
jgi:hypothetical protein